MKRRRARVSSPPAQARSAAPGSRGSLLAGLTWANDAAFPAACALLMLAALAWRLLYLSRLSQTPLFGDLILDSREYWNWASALRAAGPSSPSPYFLGPLYPHWLWLLRAVLGDEIMRVLAVQAVAGAASAVLLADAARRLTRPAIGFAIGVIAALYQMAVFFDGLILMESTLWALSCLLLWWVCAVEWPKARALHFAALGALLGLIAEGRAIALVLLAPALLLLPGRGKAIWRSLRSAAAMVAAIALIAAPTAIHNFRASGEWIPFTYNFGYNLYIGFGPEANGTDVTITGAQVPATLAGSAAVGGAAGDGREFLRVSEHVELRPGESSAYWAKKARGYIVAHPAHAASLYVRKLAMLWNAREYPQLENADEFRQLAGPLGAPFVGEFAFVGLLAVAGLARVRRGGRAAWFVAGSCAALSLAIAAFFVTDRYRHQLVPGALLMAALGIEALVQAWRDRSRGQTLRLAALLALGIALVNLPLPHLSGAKYQWGLAEDLGRRWLAHGRPDLAVTQFQRAADLENAGRVSFEGGATGAMERMQLAYNYGEALARLDRMSEALPWYERAVDLTPDHAEAVSALAAAYRRLGRPADAEPLERRLSALAGGAMVLEKHRAWEAARTGNYARAESLFSAALARDQSQFDSWGALIRLQIQRGDLAAASSSLERARSLGFPEPATHAYQALLAALAGDRRGASALISRIPQQALSADPNLAEVVNWARKAIGAR
ncbi:MAG: tetratricopeptide repeat protein [Candidatus Eiseniibacteriota bacterium]